MLAKAIEKEAALDAWIEERTTDLRQIAKHRDLVEKAARLIAAAPASEEARSAHAMLLEEFEPYLTSAHPDYTEIFVMEPETGRVVASTSTVEEGKSKGGRPYFEQGRTNLYLQMPYPTLDLSAAAMTAAIPLRAADGQRVAVLAARLSLATLNGIAQRQTGLRQTEDSFLVNDESIPDYTATFYARACGFAPQARHRGRPPLRRAAERGESWRPITAACPRLPFTAGTPNTSSA